jgi:hypothetical protein
MNNLMIEPHSSHYLESGCAMPFETETLQLHNRLSRLVSVTLRCFERDGRYSIILVATPEFPARQLNNSAEHLAYQLVQRLGVPPEQVDFIQHQPGEEPEWLRWRFQWVGSSPIQGKSLPLNQSSYEAFVLPLLAEAEIVSLREPAAA